MRSMRSIFILLLSVGVSACSVISGPEPRAPIGPANAGSLPRPQVAANNFISVVDVVEPVAERICRAEAPGAQCDFQIVVDSRPTQPPNAFQTLDPNGRPIIAFTIALIAEAKNRDELAFILGHEAAHHIAGHLPRQQESAQAGAMLGGLLAALGGAEEATIRSAADFGASVGARVYSKDFELEADALGTIIAYRAGFDPRVGSQYFNRIEDPGNQFLGTHPPNADRIRTVDETLASLR